MHKSRRNFIKKFLFISSYSLAITHGFIRSAWANVNWNGQHFNNTKFNETLDSLFPDIEFITSNKIKFKRLPRVAENGSIVPITISSNIENINKIYILVEDNPYPLIAEFYLSPFVEAKVSARFRMAKTSKVWVIVEADGKFYRQSKKVVVAIGGCGG